MDNNKKNKKEEMQYTDENKYLLKGHHMFVIHTHTDTHYNVSLLKSMSSLHDDKHKISFYYHYNMSDTHNYTFNKRNIDDSDLFTMTEVQNNYSKSIVIKVLDKLHMFFMILKK
jgi:hypothetical protein